MGPLFAQDRRVAEALLYELVRQSSTEAVALEFSERNEDALEMSKNLGLEFQFETARMYRGKGLDLPAKHIFSVTALEFG